MLYIRSWNCTIFMYCTILYIYYRACRPLGAYSLSINALNTKRPSFDLLTLVNKYLIAWFKAVKAWVFKMLYSCS